MLMNYPVALALSFRLSFRRRRVIAAAALLGSGEIPDPHVYHDLIDAPSPQPSST